jgi:hypothetical protein
VRLYHNAALSITTKDKPPYEGQTLPGLKCWAVFYTEQGVPYYSNDALGVTQWEKPALHPAVRGK